MKKVHNNSRDFKIYVCFSRYLVQCNCQCSAKFNARTIGINPSFWRILMYLGIYIRQIIKKFERKQIEKYKSCSILLKVIISSYNYTNMMLIILKKNIWNSSFWHGFDSFNVNWTVCFNTKFYFSNFTLNSYIALICKE